MKLPFFVTCKTTADIRAGFPKMVEGLDAALYPLHELLYEQYEQLELKGVPFQRARKVGSTGQRRSFLQSDKGEYPPSL